MVHQTHYRIRVHIVGGAFGDLIIMLRTAHFLKHP